VIAFPLEPASSVPPYLQYVQQVKHTFRAGRPQIGNQVARPGTALRGAGAGSTRMMRAAKLRSQPPSPRG